MYGGPVLSRRMCVQACVLVLHVLLRMKCNALGGKRRGMLPLFRSWLPESNKEMFEEKISN